MREPLWPVVRTGLFVGVVLLSALVLLAAICVEVLS